jgi:hypothetical protein
MRIHTLIYTLENAFLNCESSSFLIYTMARGKCMSKIMTHEIGKNRHLIIALSSTVKQTL